MSAPKIKIYKLPRYFTVNDLAEDRVSKVNDELLPIKEKYTLPEDIAMYRKLTGIRPGEDKWVEKLTAFSDTQIDTTLTLEDSDSTTVQTELDFSDSISISSSDVVLNSGIYSVDLDDGVPFNPVTFGAYKVKVFLSGSNEAVDDDAFKIENGKIIAQGLYRYSVFERIVFYNTMSGAGNRFVTKYVPVYDGENKFFKPFVFRLKENAVEKYKTVEGEKVYINHESEMIFYRRVDSVSSIVDDTCYYIDHESGKVVIGGTAENLFMSYVSISSFARTYIAEHRNWIKPNMWQESGGHMYLAPDVFVGWTVYTPNSWQDDNGTIITRSDGQPCFVEPGTYSISYRNGSVSFASEFDNSVAANENSANAGKAGHVYVSYSYLCGIENVDSQVFERDFGGEQSDSSSNSESGFAYPYGDNNFDYESLLPGDRVYYPSRLDIRDENSKGAMWVGISNSVIIKNVYATYFDEDLGEFVTETKPVIKTFDPFDQLTIKTSGN